MPTSTSDRPEDLVRAEAQALGFDLCRFTSLDQQWPASARLAEFVAQGRHGEMGWLAGSARSAGRIPRPWADARSAIMLGMNYGPDSDPLAVLGERDRGAISVYARATIITS